MNTLFAFDNFGLDGQWGVDEYDDFLCLSKACKERVKKKKESRQRKRDLKNIERETDIESKRADTKIALSVTGADTKTQAARIAGATPTTQAGMAGSGGIITIVLVVLGIATVGYVIYKRKKVIGDQ